MKSFCGLAEYGLIAVGILSLGYCLSVFVDGKIFQARESHKFDQPQPVAPATSVQDGAVLGELEIPHIGLSVVVVEGTEARDLREAVGHIPGTALPGQAGNVVIAGHRDTFFRPLRKIQ